MLSNFTAPQPFNSPSSAFCEELKVRQMLLSGFSEKEVRFETFVRQAQMSHDRRVNDMERRRIDRLCDEILEKSKPCEECKQCNLCKPCEHCRQCDQLNRSYFQSWLVTFNQNEMELWQQRRKDSRISSDIHRKFWLWLDSRPRQPWEQPEWYGSRTVLHGTLPCFEDFTPDDERARLLLKQCITTGRSTPVLTPSTSGATASDSSRSPDKFIAPSSSNQRPKYDELPSEELWQTKRKLYLEWGWRVLVSSCHVDDPAEVFERERKFDDMEEVQKELYKCFQEIVLRENKISMRPCKDLLDRHNALRLLCPFGFRTADRSTRSDIGFLVSLLRFRAL